MQCKKHPSFKGLRKPKRNCEDCLNVWLFYNELQIRDGKKYRSITTGEPCGLVHLLTELSISMLYGPQPEYFWRKAAHVDKEVKDHYKKIYKQLEHWRQRTPEQFKAVELILFNSFTINYRKKIKYKIETPHVVVEEETNQEKIKQKRPNEFSRKKSKKEKIEQYGKGKE